MSRPPASVDGPSSQPSVTAEALDRAPGSPRRRLVSVPASFDGPSSQPSVTAEALDRAPGSPRRRLVLVLAAITVAVEAVSVVWELGFDIGRITLSPSVLPALALTFVCGHRLLGRARTHPAATAFWALTGLSLTMTSVTYLRTEYPADVVGLLLAGLDEELVYRLAIPAVVALVLRSVRIAPPTARIAGFVVAGTWFVLLPGHRAQMDSLASMVPFIAFAALSGFMVYRSGSVLAVAATHACSNLLTILVWTDEVDQSARSAVLASMLILLVFAYGHTRRYIETDDGATIDLTTGRLVMLDLREGVATTGGDVVETTSVPSVGAPIPGPVR